MPVSGTVTLDGDPVEGALVTFSPEGDGHAAAGTTDGSGQYVLTTEINGDGAVPASYKVIITKFEKKAQPMNPEEDIDAAYAAAEAAGEDITGTGRRRMPAGPKNFLPAKYQNPQTSGLDATVTEDGENEFSFALES